MTPRRFVMGLATVLGVARRGYFIPYRYAGRIPGAAARAPYAPIERLLARRHDHFADMIGRIEAVAHGLHAIGDDPAPAPRWSQDWFPGLDAAALYAVIRSLRPQTVIEIGSGHSSRFVARAISDGALATDFVAVDPAPRARHVGALARHIAEPVQSVDLALFGALAPGDLLLVDSSHILMPGSDVDWILNRVLPELPAGVWIQVHDIFLPDPYPDAWSWRGYNEQQAIGALLAQGGYEVMFASRYARRAMADRLAAGIVGTLPVPEGALESSLWLRKTATSMTDM